MSGVSRSTPGLRDIDVSKSVTQWLSEIKLALASISAWQPAVVAVRQV